MGQRCVQLKQRQRGRTRDGLRVDRLQEVTRQGVAALGVAALELLAGDPGACGRQAGRYLARDDLALLVDPGDGQELGVLRHQGLGAAHELLGVHFLVRDIAGQPHQLLLPLEQAQAHALLGVLQVALDGFLFALDLFHTKVAKGRDDRGQEQHHGSQWRQHCKAVLPGWRLHSPPAPPPGERRERRLGGFRLGEGFAHGVKCRGGLACFPSAAPLPEKGALQCIQNFIM